MRDIFKNRSVKCMKVAQGKVYAGCMDSSIQVGLKTIIPYIKFIRIEYSMLCNRELNSGVDDK